jgi:ABC-type lipoprotein release transport system permease subunit
MASRQMSSNVGAPSSVVLAGLLRALPFLAGLRKEIESAIFSISGHAEESASQDKQRENLSEKVQANDGFTSASHFFLGLISTALTLAANRREQSDSHEKCMLGATLTNMSALASPPRLG